MHPSIEQQNGSSRNYMDMHMGTAPMTSLAGPSEELLLDSSYACDGAYLRFHFCGIVGLDGSEYKYSGEP